MTSDSYPITDFGDLLRQAPLTADQYMRHAAHLIDEQFGEGYAKKHPELVAAFMRVCAADFNSTTLAKALGAGLDRIASALERDA